MARFYAKFDSGSAGWVASLDDVVTSTGFFDRRRIAASSASAALLRDGLIASRSALSIDIYNELDATNKDGSKGIYFPPDIITSDQSTFISGNVYTSSFDGIKTPTTNTYGSGVINYSKRPTASIASTQTTLVGPTNPLDSASAAYTTYVNASAAVNVILNSVQDGAGTVISPLIRTGSVSSRTLHSIWHDPTMSYFAWDDFTPGKPVTPSISIVGAGTLTVTMPVDNSPPQPAVYLNDRNPSGYIGFQLAIAGCGTNPGGEATLNVFGTNKMLQGQSSSSVAGPTFEGNSTTWTWDHSTREISWTLTGVSTKEYVVTGYTVYYDALITSSVSPNSELATSVCYTA